MLSPTVLSVVAPGFLDGVRANAPTANAKMIIPAISETAATFEITCRLLYFDNLRDDGDETRNL